ncbi:DUF3263 domain-containing protein [Micromonospora sp. CPCC 205556]|uniref:DUF3263 domain-containing protein n=1 Tax=Micromonospora sp. CPCC 205556 TaxID=3122398 RepID=UPI002FF00780
MPPADAAPAAADRSEPSPGRVGTDGSASAGRTVPPPRVAPEAGPVPASPPRVGAPPSSAPGVPAPATSPEEVAAGPAEVAAGPAAAAATSPDAPSPVAGADELTERERSILAFEQQWWKHAGAKEQAIRDTFGLSATRYYQLLNALLDRPAALAAEPLLIGRLRRLRSSRARNRRR